VVAFSNNLAVILDRNQSRSLNRARLFFVFVGALLALGRSSAHVLAQTIKGRSPTGTSSGRLNSIQNDMLLWCALSSSTVIPRL